MAEGTIRRERDPALQRLVFQMTMTLMDEEDVGPRGAPFRGRELQKIAESHLRPALEIQLAEELRGVFDLPIEEISLERVQSGSIVAVFTVVLKAYDLASRFKNFAESVQLIRKYAEMVLIGAMDRFSPARCRVHLIHSSTVASNEGAIAGVESNAANSTTFINNPLWTILLWEVVASIVLADAVLIRWAFSRM